VGTLATVVTSFAIFAGSAFVSTAFAGGPPTLPVKPSPNSVAAFKCPTEPFSTIDLEACEGHQLLILDRKFNSQAAILWSLLDATGRTEFQHAQQAWLVYRDQACKVEARAYIGGTAAPVAYGRCELRLTRSRIKDVSAALTLYCQGRNRTGPARRCPRS
jgi:uncharacterized protein YecT (DUF1311 family)